MEPMLQSSIAETAALGFRLARMMRLIPPALPRKLAVVPTSQLSTTLTAIIGFQIAPYLGQLA